MTPKVAERDSPMATPAPEWARALDWFERLPGGPCKRAVALLREERGREGASPEEAMVQSLLRQRA